MTKTVLELHLYISRIGNKAHAAIDSFLLEAEEFGLSKETINELADLIEVYLNKKLGSYTA